MEKLKWDDPRFRRVKLDLNLTLPRIEDEKGARHGLVTFFSFATDVKVNKKKIGLIGGGVGHLIIHDNRTGEFWMARHDEVWNAYCDAVGLPYGEIDEEG